MNVWQKLSYEWMYTYMCTDTQIFNNICPHCMCTSIILCQAYSDVWYVCFKSGTSLFFHSPLFGRYLSFLGLRRRCLRLYWCDTTHSHVWFILSIFFFVILRTCVVFTLGGGACHRRVCYPTHSYVWHDSFIRVTWLVLMCDMSDSYLRTFLFFKNLNQFCSRWRHGICVTGTPS